MRSLLIITHGFPPAGGGSVMRMLKFVKYLPQFGWMPIVLTVEAKWLRRGIPLDRTLLGEIPRGVKIFRTPSPERFLGDVRERLTSSANSPLSQTTPCHKGVIAKITRVAESFYVTHDGYASWIICALPEAIRLTLLRKPDAVLTTSPPNWVHIIGYILKRLTGKPWIADFRDGWVSNPLFTPQSAIRQNVEASLEKVMVTKADRVISATDVLNADFTQRYPYEDSWKFVTVTNGYDESDFQGVRRTRERDGKFAVTYLGSLSDPYPFLEAIKMLLNEMPTLRSELQIIIAGRVQGRALEAIQTVLADYSAYDILLNLPFIEHSQALQYAVDADVLWLVIHTEKGGDTAIPGKLYEYIRAGRPILALVPRESPTAALVNTLKIGVVADSHDPRSIRDAIAELYRRHKEGRQGSLLDDEVLNKYSRRELAKQLATVLDELALR